MQFRRVEAYSETRMAESLRQAYDYWQGRVRVNQVASPHDRRSSHHD